MAKSQDDLFLPFRSLTLGGLVILALSVLFVSANAMADVAAIERYHYDQQTESYKLTASGTDLHNVQKSRDNGGPQDGDVIKISQDIIANTCYDTSLRTHVDFMGDTSITNFTLQSATASEPVTISFYQGEHDPYGINLYSFYRSSISTINIKDINFRGDYAAFAYGGFQTLTINADNVSFRGGFYYGKPWDIKGGATPSSDDFKIVMHGYNENSQINFISAAISSEGGCELSIGQFSFTGEPSEYYSHSINSDSCVLSNGVFNFTDNIGGAINTYTSCVLSDGDFNFTGNSGSYNSGAISSYGTCKLSNGEFNFTGNSGENDGGAIFSQGACELSYGEFNFNGNSSKFGGGAISSQDSCELSNGEFNFTGNSSEYGGGAISSLGACELSNGVFNFTGNSCIEGIGGAIMTVSSEFYNGEFNFTNNSAVGGGVFLVYNSLTFSDDNTTATFTGNVFLESGDEAFPGAGNDILIYPYSLEDDQMSDEATLTFKNKGTYSFDGGIELYKDEENPNATLKTSIDEAQVTIAGRHYKPVINEGDPENVEDTTNIYTLGDVSISKGGKLTAKLDYINGLTGDFTISGAQSEVELNKPNNNQTVLITSSTGNNAKFSLDYEASSPDQGNLLITLKNAQTLVELTTNNNQTATIKSSTGNEASFSLVYDADGLVSSESLFISSGRVDIKGAMTAELEVGENATFSPGNSVESLTLNGNFTLDPNAILLIEFSAYDDASHDTLTVENGTFTLDPNSTVKLYFENNDVALWSVEDEEYQLVYADGFVDTTTDLSDLLGNYQGYFTLEGRQGGLFLIGRGVPEPVVPEPSTWALLVLGVVALFMRKRVRS